MLLIDWWARQLMKTFHKVLVCFNVVCYSVVAFSFTFALHFIFIYFILQFMFISAVVLYMPSSTSSCNTLEIVFCTIITICDYRHTVIIIVRVSCHVCIMLLVKDWLVWTWILERCTISLASCRKRWLNQDSCVVCFWVVFCTVLFSLKSWFLMCYVCKFCVTWCVM